MALIDLVSDSVSLRPFLGTVELTLSHFSAMYCWDCVALYVSHTAIIGLAKGDEIKAHSSNLEPLRPTERNRAGGVCAHVPSYLSV